MLTSGMVLIDGQVSDTFAFMLTSAMVLIRDQISDTFCGKTLLLAREQQLPDGLWYVDWRPDTQ